MSLLGKLFHRTAKVELPVDTAVDVVDEPKFVYQNVQEWIARENPYQHMTEEDKCKLPSIYTSVNYAARSGNEDDGTRIFDRLIQKNVLKEDLIVYRGVVDQVYESKMAMKKNLDCNYLFYNSYVFCSLNPGSSYWTRKTRMIISVPAGSHYLFTGEYSNTPESNEIILDRNSVFRITKEDDVGERHYIWAEWIKEP